MKTSKALLLDGTPPCLGWGEGLAKKLHWLLLTVHNLKEDCTDANSGGIGSNPNFLRVVEEMQHWCIDDELLELFDLIPSIAGLLF